MPIGLMNDRTARLVDRRAWHDMGIAWHGTAQHRACLYTTWCLVYTAVVLIACAHGMAQHVLYVATWCCCCDVYVSLCACTIPITAVVSAILCFTLYTLYSVLLFCEPACYTRQWCVLYVLLCTTGTAYLAYTTVKLCCSKLLCISTGIKYDTRTYIAPLHIAVVLPLQQQVCLQSGCTYDMHVYSWCLVLFRVLTLFQYRTAQKQKSDSNSK